MDSNEKRDNLDLASLNLTKMLISIQIEKSPWQLKQQLHSALYWYGRRIAELANE